MNAHAAHSGSPAQMAAHPPSALFQHKSQMMVMVMCIHGNGWRWAAAPPVVQRGREAAITVV